jgi:hypothetical protein
MPPQESPLTGADTELCLHCGHGRMTHTRGKDTPIPCTTPRCGCRGFDNGGFSVATVLWSLLCAALVAVSVVSALIGALGVAILVFACAAASGLLAWIYDAPKHHGGRR